MIIVLMGVSGSGKTTIGTALATRLGVLFADADDYHPAANKAKMATGLALDDDDRQPWLETLNHLLLQWSKSQQGGILACSALKEKYRHTLILGIPPGTLNFILLEAPATLIAERLATRHHEYMNPNLLPSQLATLEPPTGALRIVNDRTPAEIVDQILASITVT